MINYEYSDYKKIVKELNDNAGCKIVKCYDDNWVWEVLEKFKKFADSGKIRIGYNIGLTYDDAHYLALYGLGDGTDKNRKRIAAVISAYDKVMNVLPKTSKNANKKSSSTKPVAYEELPASNIAPQEESNFLKENWQYLAGFAVLGGVYIMFRK